MKCLQLVFLCLAVLASACNNGASTTTLPSAAVANPTQTDPFTGTLAVLGTNVHLFSITVAPGMVNVTLTQAGPPPTITLGLGVGVPDALGGCSLALTTLAPAGASPQISATAQTAGQYCISVVDVGNAAAPVTYTVTVAHS